MRWFLLPMLLLACTPAEEIEPAGSQAAGSASRGAAGHGVRGSDGVEYRATTAVLESFPVQLRTTVEATNRGSAPVALTFPDGCVALLRAYPERGEADAPAWDQAGTTACTMARVEITLRPGESRRFETSTAAGEILGDSLPDGSYRLHAYVRPASGTVEIPAGTVPLAVPRD